MAEARPGHPPARRADVTVRELDGEALVYDPATADTHRLNATAFFIWQLCDGRRDERAIAREVSRTFDVSAADCAGHVEHILGVFHERRLLRIDGA